MADSELLFSSRKGMSHLRREKRLGGPLTTPHTHVAFKGPSARIQCEKRFATRRHLSRYIGINDDMIDRTLENFAL